MKHEVLRPERARAGMEFLGRGQPAPFPPAMGMGSAVSSPREIWVRASAAAFYCILGTPLAFSGISKVSQRASTLA